ncbi:3-oxoadipate CoA-transferase beta subunit [Palleronia aestuarii]|uniref:3-oxoadipate CoA-transferase beta subunit n=1 Tax=Palleronia aestuarii TaxID=568105 RepID=A0A2W7MUK6_9RHOB|nr:3-oxoacid CoA-transferase subunit B [Palleronia aestuarii]PZX11223.1 3-oxoadipate CoA-transferase beta subunit [Palleronia aestuarii]
MPRTNEEIAARIAEDIPTGAYINLGIGLPVLIGDALDPDKGVILHSENGVLGLGAAPAPGAEDPELINAAKGYVTVNRGAAFFDQCESFAMMRGGHLDVTVLGGLQVSASGDLANWSTGETHRPPAVGGAMDLAAGTKRVYVMMKHVTREGAPKIVGGCTYPLTGVGVVTRIYTDLATIDVTPAGLRLVDCAPGHGFEEIARKTDAPLLID